MADIVDKKRYSFNNYSRNQTAVTLFYIIAEYTIYLYFCDHPKIIFKM